MLHPSLLFLVVCLCFNAMDMQVNSSPMAGSMDPPPRDEPIIDPVNGEVHPPVVPPSDRPGRNTNQLQYIQKQVMPQIWKHKLAWAFHNPVNSIDLNLPDYHQVITHSMDLGCIKKRF